MKSKNLYLPFALLLFWNISYSQQHNPYKSIGKEAKIVTLSKGKYDEIVEKESLERIGSVIINRESRKIEKLLGDENADLPTSSNLEQAKFLSVDPLASKFAELSPYQYASNRPIDGTDLDGLEWESSGKYFNSVTGKYRIDYKVTLSLNNDKNILTLTNNNAKLSSIEKYSEQYLSKLDSKGTPDDPIISTDVIFTDKKGPFNVSFFNAQTIIKIDPKTGISTKVQDETYAGKTEKIGQTQENSLLIPLSNMLIIDQPGSPSMRGGSSPANDKAIGRSFSHEIVHSAGLRHPFDPIADEYDVKNEQGLLPIGNPLRILNNLLNSPANPNPVLNPEKQGKSLGIDLTNEQRQKIENTVQQQQPKRNP